LNTKSRTYNVLFNAVANIGGQILTLVFSFLTRIVFIHAFGESYLGINGLFTNILSVLSLAELGVSSTIVYCMYKPIVDKDYHRLTALMNYYKKLYRVIGTVVAVIGLILVPFLDKLVNLDVDIGNVTFYYLLYLLNTVSSYFLVYKTAILTADQKSYIIKICRVAITAVQFVVLAIVALVLKNFYAYLSLQIGFSILHNVICSRIAQKQYPFIADKAELEKSEKNKIWSNIFSMFSYQVGNVLLNNTDNILISILVNTVAVGFYSNYSMIVLSVGTFLQLLFSSIQASVGNLAAEGNETKQYQIFNVIQFMSFWTTSFCVVCFMVLFQDAITILYTDHYLLGYDIVTVCAINFYVQYILYPIYCYRSTVGLFRQTRWIMLFTSVINIVLSIVFGKIWGLFGILLATSISRIVTNFWYEPIKLFHIYFKQNAVQYFLKQFGAAAITIVLVIPMVCISRCMDGMDLYLRFITKIAMCIIIPNTVFFVLFRKTTEFRYLRQIVEKKLKLSR